VTSFQATAAFLGVLLIVGALASGLAQRSFLSLAALFVLAGFIVGDGGFEWVSFRAQSGFVEDLAFIALIVILFRDGLEVEGEMLQKAWHLPLRKLAIAMPITALLVAGATHLLIGLSWTESLLLGALLSPTDPVLTSNIVTNPRLPAVLTFLAALSTESQNFVWWRFVLQDVGLGLLYGLVLGWFASWLMPSESKRPLEHPIPSHQKSLYALGVAFATYGLTVLAPRGNGFIAVFVAAIVLGVRRPDLREHFERRADEIVEIVKLGIFVVFGSLLTLNALESNGWAALGLVAATFLIARPLAVWIALIGTDTDRQTRLFMGWFGPKGVATMTFSLLVLDQHIANGERIFDLTALVVFCSIAVHGLTDTPGANWIARHAERTAARASEAKV
jgi:sodium/hydrogen antiporter